MAEDYTPTTEVVRVAYIEHQRQDRSAGPWSPEREEHHEAAFNRWLAVHDRALVESVADGVYARAEQVADCAAHWRVSAADPNNTVSGIEFDSVNATYREGIAKELRKVAATIRHGESVA